jgi:hypothetical protein
MVIGLSFLAGGLGLAVSFLVERALRRRGVEEPAIRPWLLGLLGLVLAWVIALIGLLEVVGTSPTGRPRTLFLLPSAVGLLGVIASDALLRRLDAGARPPDWRRRWLLGVAALAPSWLLLLVLLLRQA